MPAIASSIPSTVPINAEMIDRIRVFGRPVLSMSGRACRIDCQLKKVSHKVVSWSIYLLPSARARPSRSTGQADGDAAGAPETWTGGKVTEPLPGLNSFGTGRPG